MQAAPKHDCIIIGSGSSGVAAAAALLAAGRHVLMIDAGVTIEPEREAALAKAKGEGELTVKTAPWVSDFNPKAKIPRKLLYGSDFPFQEAAQSLNLKSTGVGAEPTFARGGFSNIWGASVLPFAAHDTADWPISEPELAPHYQACAEMLELSGERDDLAEWLPLYGDPKGQLNASKQACKLRANLDRHRDALRADGIRYGRARVAVTTPCTYCALCLHGCPAKLIYSAARTLTDLEKHSLFSYQPNVIVQRLSEVEGSPIIVARSRVTGEPLDFRGTKVFVAAGAMSTTGLLLRSSNSYDRPVRLKDAQYFLLPLVMFRGTPKVQNERLHTLAQLFMEIRDPGISPYTVHLQIYSYNDVLARTVRGRLGKLLEPLARWGDAHFMLIQGYLHSDHSGGVEMSLQRDGTTDQLQARGMLNPQTRPMVSRIISKLARLAPKTGMFPLAPLAEISDPGRGFHHGGSFPMSKQPGPRDTDTLGRPFGWRNIHVVDATVLPTIPATTITYPVMANAHRIATLAGRDGA